MREALAQKRCFAQMLCRNQAHHFYDERVVPLSNNKWHLKISKPYSDDGHHGGQERKTASKVSCSMLVEVFAKPENEMEIPEGITKDDRHYCRKITHELATCLAKKRK